MVATMKMEMQDVLENNILRFWLDKMQDDENGGFYGQMTGRGQLIKEADKGAILNARILWSFSAAYRVLGKKEYLEAATRAKEYFISHFIDHEYGGVFWSLDYKGQPKDTKKQFYAIGFAIYGLSEYARATGDHEALDYAIQLYENIEEHALDHVYNGYIEACTREWGVMEDMRLSDLDANYPKSQNTHLHIIEPYTNLYQCMKEFQAAQSCNYVPAIGAVLPVAITVPQETYSRVEASLRNLIHIFTDHILNPATHHLDLFFEMDWTRGAGHLESYGHDIECSWLMHEAALVLGDKDILNKVEPVVREVAKASEKGLNPDGSMIHEANLDAGTVDDDLHWWVQAENVVGWMNIYQYFGDEDALQKALRGWEYIKQNLIDKDNGEWYWSRHKDGSLNLDDDHAGFWKCPYHNSRMCMEILERFV
ncbi:MAG: AGE family epimerase/isomerase [Prevotella sp.]|nr:AGE family epimerase/isomerase [Prevotella sp.]MBR6945045.1 AGE family epimerase/isomerase [Prevotella sp.]